MISSRIQTMKTTLLLIFACCTVLASGQGNNCSNAYALPLDSICRNFTVSTTTGSCEFCTLSGYTGNNGRITYFIFTTNSSAQCVEIDVTATTNIKTELVLFNSCNSGVAAPAGGLYNHNMCLTEGAGIWAQNLFDNLAPNTTYYLKVRTAGGYTGEIQVCGKYYTPPNKNCLGATSISSNTTVEDNNACHTPGTIPPPQLCAVTLENTAWYTYVVQATGSSTIKIENILCNNGNGNNNNGFQIGFFSGTCSNLVPITCSSGSGGIVEATANGLTGGSRIYVAIDGYSGSNCSYTISATNASPMPVKLKQFTAWKEGAKNALKWITSEEDQHNYFEVQRSEDGRIFQDLYRVNGDSSSMNGKEYRYDDLNPPQHSFYRLKQVDLDGKFSLSPVVEVTRTTKGSFELVQMPLTADELHFTIRSTRAGRIQMGIYSVDGKLVTTGWITVNKGLNSFQKNIQSFRKGHYILALSFENEKITRAFAKF